MPQFNAPTLPLMLGREPSSAPGPGRNQALRARYGAGRMVAFLFYGLGWLLVGLGIAAAAFALLGLSAGLLELGVMGLPLWVLIVALAVTFGLALVFVSQLALAVFDGANAMRTIAESDASRRKS